MENECLRRTGLGAHLETVQVQQVFSLPPTLSGLPFLSVFSLVVLSVYYGDTFISFTLYLLFMRLSYSFSLLC